MVIPQLRWSSFVSPSVFQIKGHKVQETCPLVDVVIPVPWILKPLERQDYKSYSSKIASSTPERNGNMAENPDVWKPGPTECNYHRSYIDALEVHW